MKRTKLFFFISIFIMLWSCEQSPVQNNTVVDGDIKLHDSSTIEYSKHFSIEYKTGYKIVHVYKDEFRKDTLNSFLLTHSHTNIPTKYKSYTKIEIPIKKIACLSSLYVAYLKKLELFDKLCAVDNRKYIYCEDDSSQQVINNTEEVGSSNSINFEKLAALKPDVVFTYWEQGLYVSAKLNELGIKPVLVIDHLETSPLGRAEWIKLMAALFDEEKKANDFFTDLKNNYHRLSELKNKISSEPSVLVGTKLSDAWYVPGGKSYMAQLINDAGGDYIWASDTVTGSLALTFESVLQQAQHADVWLNVYQWRNLNDVTRDDKRYAYFDAYKNKRIINNNARSNEYGGNDYWENGLLQPDQVLSDLIKIFHPELLPEYQLKYYKPLE